MLCKSSNAEIHLYCIYMWFVRCVSVNVFYFCFLFHHFTIELFQSSHFSLFDSILFVCCCCCCSIVHDLHFTNNYFFFAAAEHIQSAIFNAYTNTYIRRKVYSACLRLITFCQCLSVSLQNVA